MHLAVNNNSVFEILQKDKNLDVNIKNMHDDTPLHWAAHYNNSNAAEILCAYGADVNL